MPLATCRFAAITQHIIANCVWSKRFAAKQKDELDDQDYDHRRLQQKGAALVELVHHEAVKIAGRVQLLSHKILVIRHAHLGGGEPVESCGEHIAEELDGIVGVLGELHHLQQ